VGQVKNKRFQKVLLPPTISTRSESHGTDEEEDEKYLQAGGERDSLRNVFDKRIWKDHSQKAPLQKR
jgi:hypothetical protein